MCCLSSKLMQRVFAVNTSAWDKEQEPQPWTSLLFKPQIKCCVIVPCSICYMLVLHYARFLNMWKLCLWTSMMDFLNKVSELCFPKLLLSYYVLTRYSHAAHAQTLNVNHTNSPETVCWAEWWSLNPNKNVRCNTYSTYSKSKCVNWYAYSRGLCLPFL